MNPFVCAMLCKVEDYTALNRQNYLVYIVNNKEKTYICIISHRANEIGYSLHV